MGPVAQRHNLGVGLRDSARIILLPRHTVDDVLLLLHRICAGLIHGAHNVDLVVLPGVVAAVNVNDVVILVYSEERVGRVPMNGVDLGGRLRRDLMIESASGGFSAGRALSAGLGR